MDEQEKQVVVTEESRGLTFKDILFIIRKHWIAIVAFVVCCTAAGFAWSKLEKPVYQSTGTMLVSYEGKNTTIAQDYTFSNYISSTYVSFIKENLVMQQAADNVKAAGIDDNMSMGVLKANTSVSNKDLIIKVTYSSNDQEKAQKIAQVILDTAQEVANTTEEEDGVTKPKYHLLYDNLKVMSDAGKGVKVSHTMRNTAIGLGAGVVLAFAYVVLRELFDNTFKSSEEVERMLGVPVLAGIPDYHFDDNKKGGK